MNDGWGERKEDERASQHERTTGQCCCHHHRRLVVSGIVRAERVRQSLSGQLVVACVVEASGGQVQDGLLHDNRDEAIVVPCNVSSVTTALFVTHHPRPHCPCRPCPLLHHRCRRLTATLITVAIALVALFVASSLPAVVLVSTARLAHSHC
jgi:hypothetical protein